MFKNYLSKLKESCLSILPFIAIILLLGLTIAPLSLVSIIGILISGVMLILGTSLFSVGADMSMLKMGGYIGSDLSKSRKFFLMLLCAFIIGFVVTIAEPDLSILAEQFLLIGNWLMIIVVGLGVGVFMLLSLIRILFRLKISTILLIGYAIIFILMIFSPSTFLPIAFDASGVTTGPISVPFIMAFGLGIVAVRSSKTNEEDGFGYIGLASIGPIISMLILSLFLKGQTIDANYELLTEFVSFGEFFASLGSYFLEFLKDVAIILVPICLLFTLFQITRLKYPKKVLLRLGMGILLTYLGIVLFFVGANVGFLQVGTTLGIKLAGLSQNWILLPIGLVVGLTIVSSEPAVHILNKQIESLTGGLIKRRTMLLFLAVGVGLSVFLCVLRALYCINFLYFILPIYVICVLLSLYNDGLFSAISFDAGGVASGSMTTAFLLPFINGICFAIGGMDNILLYGFGTVSLVASMPILIVQVVGAIYTFNRKKAMRKTKLEGKCKVDIIEFDV